MHLLLLLWHFGPFLGHGLSVAEVSRHLSFYEVRMLAPRPNPNLTSQGISLCMAPPSKRVRRGGGIPPEWQNRPLATSVHTIQEMPGCMRRVQKETEIFK